MVKHRWSITADSWTGGGGVSGGVGDFYSLTDGVFMKMMMRIRMLLLLVSLITLTVITKH